MRLSLPAGLARLVLLAALVLPLGALAACGTGDGDVVNVYSHRHYDTDEALFRQFTEETGIRVRVVSASADELIARLEREGDASPADLLITVDAGRLHRAMERGLLQPVRTDALASAVPDHLRDPDGYWWGLTRRARIIAYSLERVDPDELSTYEDLTDERWNDRILARTSENIYNVSHMASLIAAGSLESGEAWARGIVENMARSPRGNDTDQIRDVAAGVGDVALVNSYYVGRLLNAEDQASRELGRQVGVFFPNQDDRGTHINVSGAGVTAHAPNRDHAVRLLEFLTSPEAQEAFAQANYEYPVREDVEPGETLAGWGDFVADPLPLSRLGELNNDAVQAFDRAGWR
ncbi:MAG: Fe(3+) ABC transporter substrate-binding protein [Gemmatimonadales bacterium]|nr:MAG: Fe(3+) ABC transporter substrate-binding protein [Gemmatimonadales bacterium]